MGESDLPFSFCEISRNQKANTNVMLNCSILLQPFSMPGNFGFAILRAYVLLIFFEWFQF